jgi:hypothetical protein
MNATLRPDHLLLTADKLLERQGRGRPRQTDLRRAISTAYYAMFHALAGECAERFLGKSAQKKTKRAWVQAYRALNHGRVKDCVRPKAQDHPFRKFPDEIRAFGATFIDLQEKRILADYDPLMAPLRASEVRSAIAIARLAIQDFKTARVEDRAAFCVFVAISQR